jgi:hypothetical protein
MDSLHPVPLSLKAAISLTIAVSASSLAQTAASSISLPTELRLQGNGWWPTKGEAARSEYVGSEACAKCHASIAATQQKSAMAHAASRASQSGSLRGHDHLAYQIGPYTYQLTTQDDQSVLTVSHDTSSVSEILIWALGVGHMGQTYLYNQKGNFYESHVSFFSAPQALDITPGHPRSEPKSLDEAAGRQLLSAETQRCFACHTTASSTKDRFDSDTSVPGVGCEACHGPGANHVAIARSGMREVAAGSIFNPARLSPVDSVDFCGACHRTWQDVVGNGLTAIGEFNVRFAPYRLGNSRCWKTQDVRLTCASCHDPHENLVQDPAWYDQKCHQCHATKAATKRSHDPRPAACPVSTNNCVTCHMPKIEPPHLHSAFTDHWIRIVRPGKPYPE